MAARMGRSLSLGSGFDHSFSLAAVLERGRRHQRAGALGLATVGVALVAGLPLFAVVAELVSSPVDGLRLLLERDLWALFLRSAGRALVRDPLFAGRGHPAGVPLRP